MARRRQKGQDAPSAGAPAWMTTYGDLVTQLLIFFVLLFAMSSVDIAKFQQALISLQGALGFLDGGKTIDPETIPSDPLPEGWEDIDQRDYGQMLEIKRQIEEGLKQAGLDATVALSLEERGLVIRFNDSVLFDLGKADIKPMGRATIDRVSQTIKDIPNQVRIEGHTDNLPIRTAGYPSNWELSTARATNVVRYFIEGLAYEPNRLSAAGYGEYRPIAPNDTAEGRQLNRRVDIVVLYTSKGRLEPR